MTASPTATQIHDLRADIGDEDANTWTDDEIERIWARVDGAEDAFRQHEAALALMCRQLLASAAKFSDYSAGATSESRSQIFKQVKQMYQMYEPSLIAAQGTKRSFAWKPLRSKPRQERTEPGDYSDDRDFRSRYDPDL